MRHLLALVVLSVFTVSARGQATDDSLTVTLPNGKVITFATVEQKARFENARAAQAARAQQTAAAQATPTPTPDFKLGHTSLDDKPSGSGVVNVSAPTFTAEYYTLAPETWVGKPVTLSVAYLTPVNEGERKDGMKQMIAYTWGTRSGVVDQHSGGELTVLAKPEVAMRLLQQCGTQLQFLGWNYKTTLIKGEFTDFAKAGKPVSRAASKYGLTIEK